MADRHREIVITSFGDRPHAKKLIERLERLTTLRIRIMNESNCETFWPGHPRCGVRNSNLAKARAFFDTEPGTTLLILDDDMIPVSRGFVQGFDLAEEFGLCLPMNPRQYAGVNAQIGADMPSDLRELFAAEVPYYSTGVNLGVMYVYSHPADIVRPKSRAVPLIHYGVRALFGIYSTNLTLGMRGTSAMDWAIWKTGIHPYMLSPLWCCCAPDAYWHTTTSQKVKIPPVFLHGGHKAVLDWFNSDPYFEEYR